MKKRLFIPTLILATLLTASFAIAGPGGCGSCDKKGGCGGPGGGQKQAMSAEQHQANMTQRLEMMSLVLELSGDQKQQLEALFNQRWQDNQQLREQMQASRKALQAARSADSFNEAEFRTQSAQKAELKTEMMVRKIKYQDEVYALLTPEQREKADKLSGLMMGGKPGRGGFDF